MENDQKPVLGSGWLGLCELNVSAMYAFLPKMNFSAVAG